MDLIVSMAETMRPENVHIFFLPFLAPGHMIPMVDLARIFSTRGVKVTIVTTPANVPLIRPTIARHPHSTTIHLLTLDLPSSVQNLTSLPTPDLTPDFITSIDSLEHPFKDLLHEHHPDFIISDAFYPWTADLGLTRLVFHGSSTFSTVVGGAITALKLHEASTDPFLVPGMPHHIEMTKLQLTVGISNPSDLTVRMTQSLRRSYGMIMNSVYELEAEYAGLLNSIKAWHVGPVSLCNQDSVDKAVRGGESGDIPKRCSSWLDSKKPGSVLYVSFGSLGRFTRSQLYQLAAGLEASNHLFIWVVNNCGSMAEWMPEGFEERVEGKGLILTGWAPQILILNHKAIGGFVTHCGWNSCLEGASAGLPMVTWPLFAEQFFNEKLVVSVLRIGVSVGAKVGSNDETKRDLVQSETLKKAVNNLMGIGEEAEERRKRAKEVAEIAKKAVEEGGSSYNDMTRLIQELMNVKAGKVLATAESLMQN